MEVHMENRSLLNFDNWVSNKMKFSPVGKNFRFFGFNEEDCEFLKGGRCPVGDNSSAVPCYCNKMIESFEKRGADLVWKAGECISVVHDSNSELYGATGGQHRLCIAIHLGMDIMVSEISEDVSLESAFNDVVIEVDGTTGATRRINSISFS